MAWFVIRPSANDLIHYGTLGQKWYHRRYQYPDGSLTPEGKLRYQKKKSNLTNSKDESDLQNYMSKNIGYSEYTKLKSPEEVIKTKSGSCHDQVMLELDELKKLGLSPKAAFLIEYDPKTGQGGTTHSFAYFNKNGKSYWLENAWEDQAGLHEYNSEKQLLDDAFKKFKRDATLPNAIMTDFGNHQKGETLQELVDKSLDNKELIDD